MNKKTSAEIKAIAFGLQEFADVHLSNELGGYAHALRKIATKAEKKPKTWNQSVTSLNKLMK